MGVDIETYSSVDLAKAGTRPYTEAPDFTILLIGYKVDDQPTRIIDLTGGAEEAAPELSAVRSIRWQAVRERARAAASARAAGREKRNCGTMKTS